MAPLRSVEEIKSQIGLFESIMKREQRVFGFTPGNTCMVCSATNEEYPEMLITILKHTYCKMCIGKELQTENAHEFIIGVLTGWSANSSMLLNRNYDISENTIQESENDTVSVESSDEVRILPRGYIYPNSKLMPKVQEGTGRPYSSLRMNAECYNLTQSKLIQKVQKRIGNKKGTYSSLRMSFKPPSKSYLNKLIGQKASFQGQLQMSSRCEVPAVRIATKKTGLPEQGELLHEISDDDHSHSESVNKP